jgi:hypothetical protein
LLQKIWRPKGLAAHHGNADQGPLHHRHGRRALEQALALVVETDLTLRSTSRAPAMAVMERALIRIAMMRR